MLVWPLKHRVAAMSFLRIKSNLKSATFNFSTVSAWNLNRYSPPRWLPQIALSIKVNLAILDIWLSSLNKSCRSSIGSSRLISVPWNRELIEGAIDQSGHFVDFKCSKFVTIVSFWMSHNTKTLSCGLYVCVSMTASLFIFYTHICKNYSSSEKSNAVTAS